MHKHPPTSSPAGGPELLAAAPGPSRSHWHWGGYWNSAHLSKKWRQLQGSPRRPSGSPRRKSGPHAPRPPALWPRPQGAPGHPRPGPDGPRGQAPGGTEPGPLAPTRLAVRPPVSGQASSANVGEQQRHRPKAEVHTRAATPRGTCTGSRLPEC